MTDQDRISPSISKQYKAIKWTVNCLAQMSDQDRISPYNISTILSCQMNWE